MNMIIIGILAVVCIVCLVYMQKQKAEIANLRKAERMKTAFIHNLSREIRTPLHTVSGMAEVISSESLYLSKSEKKNISDQIKGNTELIGTLLDEVMLYMDASAKGHKIVNERLSPNRLCCNCLQTFQQTIGNNGKIKIVFKRTLSDSFFINTDVHIVQLILSKLIHNACRFTQEGEVAVGCNITEMPDMLTIYVQDTGNGIPEDRKQSIFNWFQEPEEAADEAEIDLSITQRLAQRIGGYISLDPTYTNGTRIQLHLPIKRQ